MGAARLRLVSVFPRRLAQSPAARRGHAVLRRLLRLRAVQIFLVVAVVSVLILLENIDFSSLFPSHPSESPRPEKQPRIMSAVDPAWITHMGLTETGNTTPLAADVPYTHKWTVHPHLVVMGVPADDKPIRRYMRDAQRMSWGSYPGVARRSNDFDGLLLLLFAYSLNWAEAPFISDAVAAEMEKNEDVVMLMIPTARAAARSPGDHAGYGAVFQRFNVRKMLLFMRYLYNAFPDAPYLSKTDDDTFVYIPELMRTVRNLPRINVGYGRVYADPEPTFILGTMYLYSRDVVSDGIGDPAAIRMASADYGANYRTGYDYPHYKLDHEDVSLDWALAMRYGRVGTPPRPFPGIPELQPGLPPAEGWGKAYMDYVADPLKAPQKGTVPTADGRGELYFQFAAPEVFQRSNVVYVGDSCRVLRWRHRTRYGFYAHVAQHRILGVEMSRRIAAELAEIDAQGKIMQPTSIRFQLNPYHDHAYLAFMNGTGSCGLILEDDSNVPSQRDAPLA